MIDDPVPTMPETVPAIRPTMRTKRKAKVLSTNRESLAVAGDAGDPFQAREPIAQRMPSQPAVSLARP
jgi:hypothetical protein